MLKLKQNKIEDASLSLSKASKIVFVTFILCLMVGALYHTVPPNNPCVPSNLDWVMAS